MPFKVKVADNLSRDKGIARCHKSFEYIISISDSIDLKNNCKTIDLQNGYVEIVPIDKTKHLKKQ